MAKLYFREDDDGSCCYLKKDILEQMKENYINEVKIFEAKPVYGDCYFWCSVNQEVGEIGQGCGRFCKDYKPRNGKNGRCRFSAHCYEKINKTITLKL